MYIIVSTDFVRDWPNFKFAVQILLGKLNIKFHDDPSSGSPACSMWKDGRTDIKL